MILPKDLQEAMGLECLVPPRGEGCEIRTADVNRPGMQLCGFYEYFAFERPQVIGKVEMTYLGKLSSEERQRILETYFSYQLPCVVICRGLEPPPELLTAAARSGVPVYRSSLVTSRFCAQAIRYLSQKLAPHVTRHGVLLDVFGVGVLLSGKSGVGKSEAALELIKRGHQLVADDVVDIRKVSEDRLIGTSPSRIRYFMEIRGIGIIDVRAMYGIGAVCPSKTIDLVIELQSWEEAGQPADRLGIQDDTIEMMGVSVPYQVISIKPGRNLAIIVEVACRNLSLKRMGYYAARELAQGIWENNEGETR